MTLVEELEVARAPSITRISEKVKACALTHDTDTPQAAAHAAALLDIPSLPAEFGASLWSEPSPWLSSGLSVFIGTVVSTILGLCLASLLSLSWDLSLNRR